MPLCLSLRQEHSHLALCTMSNSKSTMKQEGKSLFGGGVVIVPLCSFPWQFQNQQTPPQTWAEGSTACHGACARCIPETGWQASHAHSLSSLAFWCLSRLELLLRWNRWLSGPASAHSRQEQQWLIGWNMRINGYLYFIKFYAHWRIMYHSQILKHMSTLSTYI